MFRHGNAQRPRNILYQKSVQFSYYIIRNCHNMGTNLVIVVKCFQYERSSDQSLQFLRPTHQNFNFISASSPFGRIFCPFFMARIQFPHMSSALTASFSVRQTPNAPFVLSYPPTACHHVAAEQEAQDFRQLRPDLDPFDTVALSRTHPAPSETTTHPDRSMKRFKKKTLNQPHKNLNNTTSSPSFHRPNKKPRKQHAPPNFQADD